MQAVVPAGQPGDDQLSLSGGHDDPTPPGGGNAYAQIVRDGKNGILGLYPLFRENVEIDRAENGELFYTYHAYTDEVPGDHDKDIIFQREDILHIPGLGFNGLVSFSVYARCVQLGISIADLDLLMMSLVSDMFLESSRDKIEWKEQAS